MHIENRSDFIEQHMPFIIKVVADYTKKYVEIENSEELSIAMEAFNSAIDKYDDNKGAFFPFAKKVIVNKLIDDSRKKKIITVEFQDENAASYNLEEQVIFKHELEKYESYLAMFNITYDNLVQSSPKHLKTRIKILELCKILSKDSEVISNMYNKKRLPITLIATKYNRSKKVLKTHKNIIIAILVAYYKDVNSIISWIESVKERRLYSEKGYGNKDN